MEWKIGEIREVNGEWYQCIESDSCGECSLRMTECGSGTKSNLADEVFGECSKIRRSDSKHVIFKKLEKVGEPYDDCGTILQRFRIHTNVTNADTKGLELHIYSNNTIGIEIKQKQEDMEEKKLNLKPFDIQKAREGKSVCTRDGRKARIICFDAKRKDEKNIIALVPSKDYPGFEDLISYPNNGNYYGGHENDGDLMMLPEKKEGWVNVYRDCDGANITKDDNIYSSKDAAIASAQIIDRDNYVATTIIKWEE